MATRLILVGGFLGAGKTTLLLAAARRLAEQGHRVGIVTNDQGGDLVDTSLAEQQQIPVSEVAGGCFCCRFPDLIRALRRLHETVNPDIILAEPVGSCTDLMATVILPLEQFHPGEYEIAPLTVLLDADRDPSRFSATLSYLYQKQQAEAEILALSKADLLSELSESEQQARLNDLRAAQPNALILALSARTGFGLDKWLDTVLNETSRLARVLEIDYRTYAEAEAGLGWLNLKAAVRAAQPFSAADWLTRLLQNVEQRLAAQQADIAHVKAHFSAPTVRLKASLTESGKPPFWDMWSPHSETDRGQLLLNARVQCEPPVLERAVRDALNALQPTTGARVDVVHLECFSPAPPQPTHRLSASVN